MVCGNPRFDRNRLRLLLEERLPPDTEAEFLTHLERCETCRRELEALAANPKWWKEAKKLLAPSPAGSPATAGPQGDPTDLPDSETAQGSWRAFLQPTDAPGSIGRLDRYDVVGLLGRGGMGVVLKAMDAELDRYVAIKVLSPELASDPDARRRFTREARAAAAVVHPHVMPIHAVGSAGDIPYLVMPYVAGQSLQARIERDGALETCDVLRIGLQVAAGLAAAHARGLVHRDIKPANILLESEQQRVLITDFGLARAVDNAGLTRTGAVAGTPHYMSPEQAEGRTVDHRSDLFSLGSLLYAMSTGRSPFRAEGTLAVLRRICDVPHRSAREVNPNVPETLSRVIDRLLAKSPDDRYASAQQVASVLAEHLAQFEPVDPVCRTGSEAAWQASPALPLPSLRSNPTDGSIQSPSDPVRQTGSTNVRRPSARAVYLAAAAALILAVAAIVVAAALLLSSRRTAASAVSPIRAIGGSRFREEFSHDFRGGRYDPSLFFPLGVDSFYRLGMFRPERDGLRIVVPQDLADAKAYVGFAPTLAIHGDFQITAGYELIQVGIPTGGLGIGAGVYLCARGSVNAAKLCRYVVPAGRQEYFIFAHIRAGTGERATRSEYFPAAGRWGRLRFERTGSALRLLAAEEDSDEFGQLVRVEDFGAGPVDLVRLEANAEGAPGTTEILWKDLEIRAKKLFVVNLPALRRPGR